MKYQVDDRVIYDGCPCIVTKTTMGAGRIEPTYMLKPLEWDKDYPYLNIWIYQDLITIDYQYYRNNKIVELLSDTQK